MDNNYCNIDKQKLENKSKNILSKLSDEEIKDKASKYKKNSIKCMSIVSVISLVLYTIFFCCLPLILEGESISGGILAFCIIVSVFSVGFPFLLLYITTLRKSEKELAMLQIKNENKANFQECLSTFEFMINSKTMEEIEKINNSNNEKSNKDKLLELKEMLDEGLITQEEYDQKKKQILGL